MKEIYTLIVFVIVCLFLVYFMTQKRERYSFSPPRIVVNSKRFEDKIVFITGGSSGMGMWTAIKFALEGAKRVVICSRYKDRFENTAVPVFERVIGTKWNEIIEWKRCDVRLEKDVKEIINYIKNKYGGIDVAVNNAGVVNGDVIEDTTLPTFEGEKDEILISLPGAVGGEKCADPSLTNSLDKVCENPIFTDAIGVYLCLKNEVPAMNSGGAIVNTSSLNAKWGSPGAAWYGASKAFIENLTKGVAGEVAPRNIRVNCVLPGAIDTPLLDSQYGKNGREKANKLFGSIFVPLGRIGEPWEVASTIAFLASDEASYITGTGIMIDGGLSATPILNCPS